MVGKETKRITKKYIDIPVTNGVGEPLYIKWYQKGSGTGVGTS